VQSQMSPVLNTLAIITFIGVSVIGVRMLTYWWSFLFHSKRYRRSEEVSTAELKNLSMPSIKIQITTRGSAGSSEVILRGIRNVSDLLREDPRYYSRFLSVELVTESEEQGRYMRGVFLESDLRVETLVVPASYQTPESTQLKARGLHYAVEQRRAGWNQTGGKTFIVHYDEESVMTPTELRKLFSCLAQTDRKILEGPIYYPLEYMNASALCRAMEANRPIGCYECRQVMESGVPLHLHGSNLVIEEALENEIGWDIGRLDQDALIAEDYVFGTNAFVKYGKEIFGWHGCVMLEQPPFSVKSAFKQRYRWIFGVLQGLALLKRLPSFSSLPRATRTNLVLGTRYRIGTFALGSVIGVLSLLTLPIFATRVISNLLSEYQAPLPAAAAIWLALLGFMWIGSVFIGASHNVADAGLSKAQGAMEVARTVCLAPIAGLVESSAALWAVLQWTAGKRTVVWVPTPKTKEADLAVNESGV
jgi:hypothetical protein